MAKEVTLPAIGKVKRQWVVVGLGVAVAIAGFAWYRRRDVQPVSETEFVDDTSTAESDEYVNPVPGASSNISDDAINVPTTNQQWAQLVTDYLGSLGYEPGFIGVTLGKYLARQGLTNDEASLVRTAWAYIGHPPDGSFSIILAGSTSDGGTPTPVPPVPPTTSIPPRRPIPRPPVPQTPVPQIPPRRTTLPGSIIPRRV